jgi:hypothetical protein
MQVFGSKGWVEVGDIEHLTTWQMRACFIDFENKHVRQKPQAITFPETGTERAELEQFADAVAARRPLAVPGGDEEHGVAVFEAIVQSAQSGRPVAVGARVSAAPAKRSVRPAKKKARRAATKKAVTRKKSAAAKSKRPAARRRRTR